MSPLFSDLSIERLNTCHPFLHSLFSEVIEHYDCTIICGHRGEEDQNVAFVAGNSKVSWPNSKHNLDPSRAVDVAPWYKESPHIRWEDKRKFYYFGGLVKGVAMNLGFDIRWGGDWDSDTDLDDQSFNDLVHFEIIL